VRPDLLAVSSAVTVPHTPAQFRGFTTRGIAVRLFITCWLIYTLHSATNIVREHYLAFAIGDHLSFRVDEYGGLHPDLFDKPGYGWHINNNPGVSMLAAVPYAVVRPVIDGVVARVREARQASGSTEPPAYQSPWPNARAFYAEAWRRGLDVKLALGALAIQVLFMAPVSALATVGMFLVLRVIVDADRTALWLALLFGFGTPVFFRTGFLNHNLIVGYLAAAGFLVLWDPGPSLHRRPSVRALVGGVLGGASVLLDYSGVVMLAGLGLYAAWRSHAEDGWSAAAATTAWFTLGASVPLAVLAGYQWASFGNPWLPAQRWMPDVAWAGTGYRGFSMPAPDLLISNLVDYRYGLFVSCPLALLALTQPWLARNAVPRREAWFILMLFVAFWLFCGGINYGRLQFNTGIRYMTSMLPFLFLLTAVVLVRLPWWIVYAIAIASVTLSWSLAMHRDVERGLGMLDPLVHVFIGGFELPVLTTISRLGKVGGEFVSRGVSPLPLFVLTGAILWGVWSRPDDVRS
jgi:hypothetical protein